MGKNNPKKYRITFEKKNPTKMRAFQNYSSFFGAKILMRQLLTIPFDTFIHPKILRNHLLRIFGIHSRPSETVTLAWLRKGNSVKMRFKKF